MLSLLRPIMSLLRAPPSSVNRWNLKPHIHYIYVCNVCEVELPKGWPAKATALPCLTGASPPPALVDLVKACLRICTPSLCALPPWTMVMDAWVLVTSGNVQAWPHPFGTAG